MTVNTTGCQSRREGGERSVFPPRNFQSVGYSMKLIFYLVNLLMLLGVFPKLKYLILTKKEHLHMTFIY